MAKHSYNCIVGVVLFSLNSFILAVMSERECVCARLWEGERERKTGEIEKRMSRMFSLKER